MMSIAEISDVKPCPFCGEAPGVEDWQGVVMVACCNEDCFMFDAPLVNVTIWNVRTNGS
jgi:hypothetical protein